MEHLHAPLAIDCPRGYYAAIATGYGMLGIGIDGNDAPEQYPFVPYTNCYAADYATGEFYYLDRQEEAGFMRNFMMRTWAAPYDVAEDALVRAPRYTDAPAVPVEAPALSSLNPEPLHAAAEPEKIVQNRVRYNVYRFAEADYANRDAWTKLAGDLKSRTYVDTDWKNMLQGVYYYAVEAVYTGGITAQPAFSPMAPCKMYTTVTFTLNTAETPTNEAEGAYVQLVTANQQRGYTGNADAEGKVTLSGVWKDTYQLFISLPGFTYVADELNLGSDDSYAFEYTLSENRVQPYRLIIDDELENPNDRLFIWNYDDMLFDDFEAHESFAINSPGTLGWSYIDGDGGETGGLYTVEWPNQFQPMAFIVFDQMGTSIGEEFPMWNGDMVARSGNKYLSSWAAYGFPNDDWLISPKLYFDEDFKVLFYAQSMDGYNYPETFEVRYSTTGKDADDFTGVVTPEGGQLVTEYYYSWRTCEYDIPAEAKYVAIHHISDQCRVFKIDDVQIATPANLDYWRTSAPRRHRMPSAEGAYEVYLNGEKVAQTSDTRLLFENLPKGHYTAGVVATYTSGKTAMSTIEFDVTTEAQSAIETLATEATDIVYYDLRGIRLERPARGSVVIAVSGGHARKIMLQ